MTQVKGKNDSASVVSFYCKNWAQKKCLSVYEMMFFLKKNRMKNSSI